MKFTRISTPKKSKKKTKKKSKKSEDADEDFETQTRKVIEILGSPVSVFCFLKQQPLLLEVIRQKKIHMIHRLVYVNSNPLLF